MKAMSEIVKDKNVPIPKRRGGGRKCIYPWRSMEVGDSFHIPNTTTRQFAGRMTYAAKTLGVRFTTRAVDGGVRVWRTA
jgi:hypothetical protein